MRITIGSIVLAAMTVLPSVRLSAQQDTATQWYDRIRFEGDVLAAEVL